MYTYTDENVKHEFLGDKAKTWSHIRPPLRI